MVLLIICKIKINKQTWPSEMKAFVNLGLASGISDAIFKYTS
jgi:hypothetical protein